MSCLALRSEVSSTLRVIASVAKQPRGRITRPDRAFARTPVSRRAMGCIVASLLATTGSSAVENEA
jgi:hypothetical protein